MIIGILFLIATLHSNVLSVVSLVPSERRTPIYPCLLRKSQRRSWRADFFRTDHEVLLSQRLLLTTTRSESDTIGNTNEKTNRDVSLEWVSIGISAVYLAHFSSLYTQLPGLIGQTGLLPITKSISDLEGQLWALNSIPTSPEMGVELFAVCGILVSAAQLIVGRTLRQGPLGVVTFGLLWICWHDLVVSGGRFMQYQMDFLLLDAAPLTLLAASGLANDAAIFGYRWLLSRLYIGAGAVKLLSCDPSWRDLSAVHWHFQSQPLPNPIAAWAFWNVPDSWSAALTWSVLVVEMAAPFLFLAPSRAIRRAAFCIHVLLMAGIAFFGNFGPLQFLLVVIGFALLDDDPMEEVMSSDEPKVVVTDKSPSTSATNLMLNLASAGSLALATGGALWAVGNVGATTCRDTLAIAPLVYGLIALGFAAAILSPISTPSSTIHTTANGKDKMSTIGNVIVSLLILAGSASVMANGLGVVTGIPSFLDWLNFGAIPYGLFASMTGVNGRPVATILIESALDQQHYDAVPLLYQVNDPDTSLPFLFPHFPRLDWTLWFLPLGSGNDEARSSLWLARLLHGISVQDAAVLHLLNTKNGSALSSSSSDTPAIVRVVSPRTYEMVDPARRFREMEESMTTWIVKEDNDENTGNSVVVMQTNEEKEGLELVTDPTPWPSTPILRSMSDKATKPEHFIWECFGATGIARQAIRTNSKRD